DKCTLCAKCADFCRYNAIAVISDRLLFFEQLCHGCGGCKLVCQAGAIGETEHHVGVIEKGGKPDLPLYHGMLDIGQPFGVPIIRDLKSLVNNHGTVIFDSPPGTACPAVEAMRDADYCILVTEPTPFGLHDLKLTVDVVRELDIPFGVVINRDGIGDDRVEKYCSEESIALLAKIPNDIRIARLYSKGVPIVEGLPVFQQLFMEIFERAREAV
ncbi:MAG: (4Fe-4S)-binding protein, partial [Candidatus Proteinoplasmatales archaeon SG8-5]